MLMFLGQDTVPLEYVANKASDLGMTSSGIGDEALLTWEAFALPFTELLNH